MHSLWLIGGQIKKTPPANSREPNHLEEELQDDKRRSVDEFPVLIPTRIEWDPSPLTQVPALTRLQGLWCGEARPPLS